MIDCKEEKTKADLVNELLSLDPPASAYYLIRIARHYWTDEEVKPIIHALITRADIDIASLKWLLHERGYALYGTDIGEAILRHPNCTIQDTFFVYHEQQCNLPAAKSLREKCAQIIVKNEQATIKQLIAITDDSDNDPDVRKMAAERIQVMKNSRASQIMHQITGSRY